MDYASRACTVAKTPLRFISILSSRDHAGLDRFLVPDGGIHVGLDLGRRESPVVDADLVDEALEEFVPDHVPAEAERAVGHDDRAREGGARDLDAVDIEA